MISRTSKAKAAPRNRVVSLLGQPLELYWVALHPTFESSPQVR